MRSDYSRHTIMAVSRQVYGHLAGVNALLHVNGGMFVALTSCVFIEVTGGSCSVGFVQVDNKVRTVVV